MNLNDVNAGLTSKSGWNLSMFTEDDIKRIHEATLYVLEKTGINTNYYGNVDNVDIGLISATNIQQEVIVYADNIQMSNSYID